MERVTSKQQIISLIYFNFDPGEIVKESMLNKLLEPIT